VDEDRYRSEIEADFAQGQAVGVSATPSMLINDTLYVGAYPMSELSSFIEAELQGR
jgi:protein-disulfide isomerase